MSSCRERKLRSFLEYSRRFELSVAKDRKCTYVAANEREYTLFPMTDAMAQTTGDWQHLSFCSIYRV